MLPTSAIPPQTEPLDGRWVLAGLRCLALVLALAAMVWCVPIVSGGADGEGEPTNRAGPITQVCVPRRGVHHCVLAPLNAGQHLTSGYVRPGTR